MADAPEPHRISQPLIMLCEGEADNEFFQRLIRSRQLPAFSFPFPPPNQSSGAPLHGRDGFINMLRRLNTYFDFDPDLRERTRGILIALDAANSADESFMVARDQIVAATRFGVPIGRGAVAHSIDRPPVCVITVPDDAVGSLESLCMAFLRSRFPDHADCMDAFLECCPTDYTQWNAEGLDKARLRCMIASTYRPDPSRSTRLIFAGRNGEPPAVDIADPSFDGIAGEIRGFCQNVGVT